MSDAVRFGFVGTGGVALHGLIPQLAEADVQHKVRMTAFCDPVLERAQAAARQYGVPHAFRSFEELIDARVVDAVSIASPIKFHYEQGKLAIDAGLHIHFNKTMTTTVDEANELEALARARGVKIVPSPGCMLHPARRAMRRLVREGALGKVAWAAAGGGAGSGVYHLKAEAERHGEDMLSNVNPAWYFRKPGGGPLYDVIVYYMTRLTGVLGPAKRVTAFSGIVQPDREFRGEKIAVDIDDNTLMLLDFGDACFGFVYGAYNGSLTSGFGGFVVFGANGTLKYDADGPTLNGKPVDYPERKQLEELRAANPKTNENAIMPHVTGAHLKLKESHVFADIMELIDWVREDKPTIVSFDHARHVIDIFESAYRSAETGQTQELRTTFKPLDG